MAQHIVLAVSDSLNGNALRIESRINGQPDPCIILAPRGQLRKVTWRVGNTTVTLEAGRDKFAGCTPINFPIARCAAS
jgi:hypothetical protein